MKDLFLLTADADALAFMRSVLTRNDALGIHPVTVECMRHPMKDAGVIKDGPETARMYKNKCHKALLMWDYHGSGHEKRLSATDSEVRIQDRLDGVTWADNSGAVVVVPEIEEWLWHCLPALAAYFAVEQATVRGWMNDYAAKKKSTLEAITTTYPKELFEFVCIEKLRRSISPRDFEGIGKIADVHALQNSGSFARILILLREWFPKKSTRGC